MATSTDLRSAIEEVQSQLPAEQLPADGDLPLGGPSWSVRLERRVGSLPWWVISAATHAVLFLMIALLATTVASPVVDEVVISTDVIKQKPPEYDPEKKRDIFKSSKDVQAADNSIVDNPVVSLDKNAEQSDHFETDNNSDKGTARGSEDAISDIPLGGTGVVGTMGVGGGGMAGCFGYRDGGGRKKAVGRFGGSQATESSVEAALRWLARHQEKDGHWDAGKYEGTEKHDVGCTALALLAFLGAGYTEKSGQFADNVKRAEDWLVKQQQPDGHIAAGPSRMGYNHAISGLALAEAYGMGKDPRLGEAAQKAADYSLKVHQCPYSGWRYAAKEPADTSVTGWFVMQLKSAKIAGLKIDGSGFQGATAWLDKATTKDGRAGYQGPSEGSAAMTAVGMVCRQFMGAESRDPVLVGGAQYLATALPKWNDPASAHWSTERGFYYWYYGTLAMFQMGGDHWKKWNEAIKPVLVDNQRKGPLPLSDAVTDLDGSWDTEGVIDGLGGRVFTTALGALTMEVYYRYLPMYAK